MITTRPISGRLASSMRSRIFGWLVGYSGLLGPIAGIMIADYFVVRGRTLELEELYRRGGSYEYTRGFNYRALAALLLGVTVALVGLLVPALRWLYDYAWFVGFGVSAVAYTLLMGKVLLAQREPAPADAVES